MSVELLSPAGSPENLHFALNYGADAVYAGVPRWSLRVRGNGFTRQDFEQGINEAHAMGKKFFAVLNAIPHMRRLESGAFKQALLEVAALKPDAFIMADPGLIMQARDLCPEIPVHLSVQANTVNAGTVKFWQRNGVTRCILARELPLSEIEMIRNECPDAELEVFVHGALCIAVSGRCLISGLLARRDANTGACNNSCRWPFKIRSVHAATADDAGVYQSEEGRMLEAELEDHDNHPGEWMKAQEDCNGTYLMNSKDLCALPLIKKLMDIGIDSLKIEGRSRSPFYVGAITRAYRLAINAIERGEEIPDESWLLVNSIPSRGYTTALLEPHRPDETQDYETNSPSPGRFQVTGAIQSQDADGLLHIAVKNRFENTSCLKILTPNGLLELDASELKDERKRQNITVAPGSGYFVTLPCKHKLDLSTAVLVRDDGVKK
ncbi:MAG: U32 family peptidase C-terminal domain-containing protein [Succinatimonas sp.]|nr:U32 family peptidase C-terminal domain-containing protein [Succinatimonas sp.]